MSVSPVPFPHAGIQEWDNPKGIHIFRLHYSADAEKTPEWAEKQKAQMDESYYRQEYEIDFSAKLGQLLYRFQDEHTLEKSFPIPHEWTRYFALDPHPRKPHAFLWIAVDPWGDAYIYRELWPSKVYGIAGNVPEDDNHYSIRDYIETVMYLEGAENNDGKAEKIYKRVIDYSARAFKNMATSEDQRSIQEQYEEESRLLNYPLWFEDAVKDHDAGVELVNQWLKPKSITYMGKETIKSKLHIFSDKCPELVHQLRTVRWETQTAVMAEKSDPQAKERKKRNDLTDDLRYLCMNGLEHIGEPKYQDTWKPIFKGVAY